MFHIRQIASLDAPELQPYLTLRRPLDHHRQRIFVAEGEKVVRRLLDSGFGVVSALITEGWLETLALRLERRPEDVAVFVAPKEALENLTGFSFYQGLLAVGRIPPAPTLDEILAQSPQPRLFVAVDQIANAENMGVIVRNCAAFRTQALLAGATACSPFLRRAVRSSMGAIFHLPVMERLDLPKLCGELRRHNVRTIAAHPHASGKTLAQSDLRSDCCIVFGGEGHGLSPDVLRACDEAAAIPMAAAVDSLNVHTSSAVFLYESNRQRGRM